MDYDAVVVGAGPNGLSAAIELARAGLSVLVVEANDTVGGAARTEELTLPGVRHDVGSSVYPMAVASPFFGSLPLTEHGLEWIHAPLPLAHVLDGGRTAVLDRDVSATADGLGRDATRYRDLVEPFVEMWPTFVDHVLGSPLRPPKNVPLAARFGLRALRSATALCRGLRTEEARALMAGNAAHSGVPLDRAPSGAIGLVLMVAGHAVGWPIPRGGAGAITGALASYLQSLGGVIECGRRVERLEELPSHRVALLAVTHRQAAELTEGVLAEPFRKRLAGWRYGPGAFKLDWALSSPIPWSAPEAREACTVHVGGTAEEVARAEEAPYAGTVGEPPFLLVTQPSLFDDSRAPEGIHTAWAYCHVPNGWSGDATEAIEARMEDFAPGFRDTVRQRSVLRPAALEAWDANLVGGDVNGGEASLAQTFGPLPHSLIRPWGTPSRSIYLCSASSPPGGGVHGMAGYHAARAALRSSFGVG